MINLNFEAVTVLMPKIGADAFCLLIAISKHMDVSRSCFPGRVLLMKLTGLKKDAYYKAMTVLKEKGCLSAFQEPGKDGKFGRNIFKITAPYISVYAKLNGELEEEIEAVSEIPEPCPKKPDAVAPDAVKSDTKYYQQEEVLPIVSNIYTLTEKKPIEISHIDRPLPKTDIDLKNKILAFLNAENDISEESRRAIFEKIARRKISIPGGLTLPETLAELTDWWAGRHFAKNRDLNMNYAGFIAAFKTDLDYYNSVQPDEKKQFPQTQKNGQQKTSGSTIRTQYDEEGNVIPRTKTATI